MSSITLVAGFPGRQTRRTSRAASVRLTRRGRVVLLLALLAAVLVTMVLRGGFATASLDAGQPEPVRIIQVAPGDTLYSIAAELDGPGDIRAKVQRIRDLNSLPSGSLQAGQRLAVPAH